MTFFVDANVFVYLVAESPASESCLRVLEAVASGEADGRTSPAVLQEVWHVTERLLGKRQDGLIESALTIFSPLVPVTAEALSKALAVEGPSLDAQDRLHVGTCAAEGIETILSGDRGFDEVAGIRRVDPFDAAAVEQLLAA
ncbi:MAG TPA: type II toxin-antitoxin system VapC family toxin [Solirubrobacterales bacterium]|nr:type II toxin-antitoxin system VapC family toxin [Solirubrobacterales bacterium]